MKVAIIDDSRLARLELKEQLEHEEQVELVGEAASVDEAVALLNQIDVDLVLLDIDLPDGDGFDVLERLNSVPYVIFVTAFNEFAIKSFEYNTLDYLLKPVREERLKKAMDKVKVALEKNRPSQFSDKRTDEKLNTDKRIFIKDGEHCFFISVDEIYALESLGNYTKVHFHEGAPCVYRPISKIFERLDQKVFFKASRSWVINTHFIQHIEALQNGSLNVSLKNHQKVVISKRQAAEFKRAWTL